MEASGGWDRWIYVSASALTRRHSGGMGVSKVEVGERLSGAWLTN